ncbi:MULTISPECIES: type VI secretion system-associated FHA domain protein TagH [unclassified Motilimonas]|uniref:type VI secretion system-associated FHA domain protein TagH n=1 Tax=unclassified Motilimonas TaxID=2643697 RepID=UPI001E41D137|nr:MULTISPECIES: type VI secretion system-associated FHA domain protein TagH [unclassified Motilimonas]MCE0559220.1 type VI secretion system-associated FHA domain protein TagH [Motilimonas sp. E26]MDO6527519.1 type VI secretion system-associated FHA domain protein TagH [Motilimonas sp. 1_MG-2023]
MNTMQNKIELTVVNSEKLQPGLQASHTFYAAGGSIGSDYSDDWHLTDQDTDIVPLHCVIELVDHDFCLRDSSGRTFVNRASFPVGRNQMVRLKENDELQLGQYRIRCHFEKPERYADDEVSFDINQFIDQTSSSEMREQDTEKPAPSAQYDPLLALDQLESARIAEQQKCFVNPVAEVALDQSDDVLVNTHWEAQVGHAQADAETTVNAAMNAGQPISNQEFTPMNESSSSLDPNTYTAHDASLTTEQHLALGPVFRGLESSISAPVDTVNMQSMAEELGSSLNAAINGLLALHKNVDKQRYGVIAKNLQPIEDNPLRLGLDYDQTMNVMFGPNKSPVHLSAPSAIAESLRTIQHHQIAVQEAIGYALKHILGAFSPDTLMKRFKHYRTTEQALSQDSESWAWHMYSAYFSELESGRQQGFEKLFWEIFEQAYDRKLRELQKQEQG